MLKKVCIIVAQKLRNRSMKYSAPLKTGLCSSFLVCVVHFFLESHFHFWMRCQQKLLNNLNQNEKCNRKRSEK